MDEEIKNTDLIIKILNYKSRLDLTAKILSNTELVHAREIIKKIVNIDIDELLKTI